MGKYKVAVIGAGVAGMTAAHELSERGFEVHVFESAEDPLRGSDTSFRIDDTTSLTRALLLRQPAVGGLAATQWYRIPFAWESSPDLEPMQRLAAASEVNLAEPEDWWQESKDRGTREFLRYEGRWPLLPFAAEAEVSSFVKWRIAAIARRLANILEWASTTEYLIIGGVASEDEEPDVSLRRAKAVAKLFLEQCQALGLVRDEPTSKHQRLATFLLRHPDNEHEVVAEVRVAGFGALHADEPARGRATQRYVEIRLLDRLLPGEHGYRFFPAFYHHVFDTMKRIPLLVRERSEPFMAGLALDLYRSDREIGPPRQRWETTARTVFDNLRSVELHALDSGGKAPVRPMQRFNTRSLRSLRDMLDLFQENADVPLRDIVLGQLKLVRYATSCKGRRVNYEGTSWSEFSEASLGSKRYQDLLEHWPQALVGLQASRADARTTGTVLLQLMLDQVRDAGFRDGTLNAPTSEAWLEPWKRYLEVEHDIVFYCGRVDAFELEFESGREKVALSGVSSDRETRFDRQPVGVSFDYVVIATSADVTKRLGKAFLKYLKNHRPELVGDFERSPFRAAAELVPDGPDYQEKACSEDPYEHFSGIQFFLQTDFAPLRGHVYYPNSPWRLSSVSQTQFRLDRPGALEGYTGVISVVIGAFDEPGRVHGRPAWECSADEIAEEVWDQITWSLKDSPEGALPPPQYYAIDQNLVFSPGGKRLLRNKTPFLVNSADRAGAFAEQAGAYRVHMGHFVFAGTYLDTFTRLVTMEAANESARHAVNAVIRHGRVCREQARGQSGDLLPETGQLCPIFDPEDREPEELELLRRIDAGLLERGLPHWMDILAVERRVLELFERGEGRGGVAEALLAVLESAGGLGGELLRMLRSIVIGRP